MRIAAWLGIFISNFIIVNANAEVQSLTFFCGDFCYIRTCNNGNCTQVARKGTCLPNQGGTFAGQIIDMEYLNLTEYEAQAVYSNNPAELEYLIIGSNQDDKITGWDFTDRICGRDGSDEVRGNRGRDYLNGNKGNDYIRGGKAMDCIRGGQGYDELFGDKDADMLIGDLDYDNLDGGDAYDFCFEAEGSLISCELNHPSSNDACDYFGISL